MSLRQFLLLIVAAILVSGCGNSSNSRSNSDVPPADGGPTGDGGDDSGGDDGGGDGSGDDGSGDGGSDDGGDSGNSGSSGPPEDVSGEWFSRTEVNAVNCGLGEFIDAQAFVITQNEADISVLASTGDTFTGTVSGDIVEWSGSYDERGGTTTFTSLTLIASGDSVAGDASWTWTDGTDSCNGTMVIMAGRGVASGEAPKNSRPPGTVDPVTLENGVAFYSGEIFGVDSDYFAVTTAADATVQAQLSHFDTSTDALYLEVLDFDLNQLAVSDNADSFEALDVEMTAGETYFIGVLTKVEVTSPITYLLSIDAN